MFYPISDANCITLNTLKAMLSPESRQTDYLTMLFPPELHDFDSANLLDFIYEKDDITLRNARTSFTNGNITRQNDKQTYSRANQTKLTVIARWLRCPGSEALWTQFLAAQFPLLDHRQLARTIEEDESRYPAAFFSLLEQSDQSGDSAHLLLLLILWAIFGERITTADGIFQNDPAAAIPDTKTAAAPPDRTTFCEGAFQTVPEIEHVDFSFHKGDFWLLDSKRIEFLLSLINRKIHLRVLVDLVEPSRLISSHMEHSKRFVLPHEMVLQYWREFQQRNPEYVHVRFSPVPILRNYCCFESADPAKSAMRLTFYSYGHKNFSDYYVLCPEAGSKPFTIFREEFAYLWAQGVEADAVTE